MEINVAGIIGESIVDGPGIRLTVFCQGCPHHCPGCQNPETWEFAERTRMRPEQILSMVKQNPLIRGVTLSGGEPFAQAGQQQRHDVGRTGHIQEAAALLQEGHCLVLAVPDNQQDDADDGRKQRAEQRAPAGEEDGDQDGEHTGAERWDGLFLVILPIEFNQKVVYNKINPTKGYSRPPCGGCG